MLFNSKIAHLNDHVAHIEYQIEALQAQLSKVQSQIQAVQSVEQAAESACAQVRQAINGIRSIDPELEETFKQAVLSQFGEEPQAYLPPQENDTKEEEPTTPDAPTDKPDTPDPKEAAEPEDKTVEVVYAETVLNIEAPEYPELRGYTVKELRKMLGVLGCETPSTKVRKQELIDLLKQFEAGELREALDKI